MNRVRAESSLKTADETGLFVPFRTQTRQKTRFFRVVERFRPKQIDNIHRRSLKNACYLFLPLSNRKLFHLRVEYQALRLRLRSQFTQVRSKRSSCRNQSRREKSRGHGRLFGISDLDPLNSQMLSSCDLPSISTRLPVFLEKLYRRLSDVSRRAFFSRAEKSLKRRRSRMNEQRIYLNDRNVTLGTLRSAGDRRKRKNRLYIEP